MGQQNRRIIGGSILSQNTLITYASRTGSTQEVAQVIGKIFTNKGSANDIYPIDAVATLGPYDAIIAGSAIQNRSWLPEAIEFVRTHKDELSKKSFAIFSLCMTLAMRDGKKYRPQVSTWLQPVRTMAIPISEGLFAGVLDINKIPSFPDRLKFRISVALGVWSEGDHRDWEAIHAWAHELHQQFFQLEELPG